ncbi:hypothetical protein ASPACDRAFT_111792 [Aspergillus aculeatus ATCC 16872]|uniref:Nucleoporin NDC1 n=1 Tax=Aspergillus aculeatus (strain ATCC 16872 / CBS 172.66 / WB 5094) TaxID=690307 RepID=A0A1L9X5R0_ASPA1|nr:uncharacterized protein ASPACDRAFT_111792 [Aspergillus aculeatus ATCC 16872]OJK03762.1 hypothetical protein ASPACDRAFT_111792 [Aspergillus aculeatus ATCC 16872]
MAAARPRPYRRILTSALHRRFVHASALALLVCYIVAFALGEKSSFFWSWFPIGACGIRTVLLSLCSLVIFVLRVGQMHLGARTTASSISTLKQLLPFDAFQTFGWYMFSAWWFNEIYRWSSPLSAHLEWVNRARPHERASLNERAIYLYTYHLVLAVIQSLFHLYDDYDRVPVPVAKRSEKDKGAVQSTAKRIQAEFLPTIVGGIKRSLFVALACPLAYSILLRRYAWSTALYFAKLFWDIPRSAAHPPGFLPPITPGIIFRSMVSGALLMLCWQSANLFFSIFLSKEPLKRGQPLTADAKDPNGSLLTGLKAKKETVRAFAFWELLLISQQFPDRRKAIFNDIDREEGAAWSQIFAATTEVVKGVATRVKPNVDEKEYRETREKKSALSGTDTGLPPKDELVLRTLPRLTDPLKAPNEVDIFAPVPKTASHQEAWNETIKSFGNNPDWTPTARAKAVDVLDRALSAVLSPEQKQKLLATYKELLERLTGPLMTCKPEDLHPLMAQALRTPIGRHFQHTYARRLSGIVLGTPHANICSIVHSIDSITGLSIKSLEEDSYGKVQADVPALIRLFTETIQTLEPFINGGLDAHWTDVDFPPSSNPEAQAQARRVPDVDLVLTTLKHSLKDILSAFNKYFTVMDLDARDLRLAEEAAGVVDAGL